MATSFTLLEIALLISTFGFAVAAGELMNRLAELEKGHKALWDMYYDLKRNIRI